MNLSDQNNGSVLKHGAHTEGGLENVYPPVANAESGGRGRGAGGGAAVALAEHEPHDGHSVIDSHEHMLHDSHDGPAPGHHGRDTHALGAGAPTPPLDLDVTAMGISAFPLDGQGPGQGEDHVVHSENNLAIDLPLDADTLMASTLLPDH